MNETQLRELILKAISEAVGDTAGAQSAAPVPPASGAVESGEVRDPVRRRFPARLSTCHPR